MSIESRSDVQIHAWDATLQVSYGLVKPLRVDLSRDSREIRVLEAAALVGLEVADRREDHVPFRHRHMSGDGVAQSAPAPTRQHRQSHHVEEARGVLLRVVEVGVRVEPHHAEIAGPDSGRRAGAAVAVAGQHQRERVLVDGPLHLPGEPADQLDDAHDLRI